MEKNASILSLYNKIDRIEQNNREDRIFLADNITAQTHNKHGAVFQARPGLVKDIHARR